MIMSLFLLRGRAELVAILLAGGANRFTPEDTIAAGGSMRTCKGDGDAGEAWG